MVSIDMTHAGGGAFRLAASSDMEAHPETSGRFMFNMVRICLYTHHTSIP